MAENGQCYYGWLSIIDRKECWSTEELSDRVAEIDCTRELIFLHCIIHQEVLGEKVLGMKHVVDPVVKIVKFIRARGQITDSLSRFWKILTRITVMFRIIQLYAG